MTTQELEQHEQDAQRPERVVAVRRLNVEIETARGRTVSLRFAPFRERAVAADGLGFVPKGVRYEEELMPGLYDEQMNAVNKAGRGRNVLLNFEHHPGMAGLLGHALALRAEKDGYYGDFRIQETPDGDKALDLVRNDVLTGASVESYWLRSKKSPTGVVQRVKAHLEAVALCREGAYPGAVVTGLRTDEILFEDITLDEELLPVTPDPELIERCRRLGIRLPQRYEAHPAETDTPAETGTSESGTRQDQANADLGGTNEHHPERA